MEQFNAPHLMSPASIGVFVHTEDGACLWQDLTCGCADTPGYEPEVGSRILKTCVLQKARTWDDAVADKFKVTTYDEIFENKKVRLFPPPPP